MSDFVRFSSLLPVSNAAPAPYIYQLAPPAIQYLTALMEAADGIGLVRTLDESRGLIECWVMPDFMRNFEEILAAISQEWPVQEIGSSFE